jgi:hypothetical protein
MNSDNQSFDWGRIITKPVYTSDNKHVGHVDGLDDEHFIIKYKIIHAKYYEVDRDLLETFEQGKVRLKISEEELNSKCTKEGPSILKVQVKK